MRRRCPDSYPFFLPDVLYKTSDGCNGTISCVVADLDSVRAVGRVYNLTVAHVNGHMAAIADQVSGLRLRAYGVGVTLDEAQPGDLICYYGHIGIYIGNNQIVHAMDEKNGITVKTIGYNGKPILTVRRIFG